jgi:aminoglycoside phosphotransferase (APT) family kinase protein
MSALERARAVLDALDLAGQEPEALPDGLSSHAWRVRPIARDLVLRLPVNVEDGVGTYPIEHALLARLTELGARVPAPIQGSWLIAGWSAGPFSLTAFVPGVRLRPESSAWAAAGIAAFLRRLHSIPATGFGPLAQSEGRLIGRSGHAEAGLVAAFEGLPLWPFGGVQLADHPALVDRPELASAIEGHAPAIRRAALDGHPVIVHSDLHEENVLEDDGRLGFIDFGECFVGAAGWDIAAIAYFGGWPLAARVLAAYRDEPPPTRIPADHIAALALSFGLYRWQQDRRLGVDGDAYDNAFLHETLARLNPR